jgi:hypothetical protein
MSLVLDDVISLDEAPEPSAQRVRRAGATARTSLRSTRGAFLRRSAAVGVGVGFATLGVFPPARKAFACAGSGVNARDLYGDCPAASSGFGCSPACGPSTVYGDTCDSNNWHFSTGNYRNRPNECNSSTGADAWMWYRNCNCPGGNGLRPYRCHDGCKLISGSWVKSICRWIEPGCI